MPVPFPPGYNEFVFQFGRAEGLPLTTERMVWNTAGVYNGILSNESALSIVSDSDLDKAAGGGATELVFFYQGEDGIERYKIVTLNGLTPVNVADVLADVSYKAWITGSESVASNDFDQGCKGNITCYETGTPANILWQISAGECQTLMCFYRVPTGKYLELTQIDAFPQGAKPLVMRFRAKSSKSHPWRSQAIGDALDTAIPVSVPRHPQVARPGAYLAITAIAEQAGTNVSAYFIGKLKDYLGDTDVVFPF